jgi:hypothetical protein
LQACKHFHLGPKQLPGKHLADHYRAGQPGPGTMCGEETARTMLESAGFGHTVCHKLEHDPFGMYFIASHEQLGERSAV